MIAAASLKPVDRLGRLDRQSGGFPQRDRCGLIEALHMIVDWLRQEPGFPQRDRCGLIEASAPMGFSRLTSLFSAA